MQPAPEPAGVEVEPHRAAQLALDETQDELHSESGFRWTAHVRPTALDPIEVQMTAVTVDP
jgi:hypothetical protein